MALRLTQQLNLFEDNESLIEIAIKRIQEFVPEDGYYVAFSGGKDSQTALELVRMAGVPYEAHYHPTTVDPPELIYFIREHYPEVIVDRPESTMWKLIVENVYPPTRLARYCCRELKENGGHNRTVVTGIRWAESNRRSKRRMVERCFSDTSKLFVNPIIEWEEHHVWEFIKQKGLPYCKMYDEGYSRLGCIGCPMKSKKQRLAEFKRYPKFRQAYLRAFDRMLKERKKRGLKTSWETAEDVMYWWIYEPKKSDPFQAMIFE